jgi:aminocarboxymuconate-semialdehyde decarboxylase
MAGFEGGLVALNCALQGIRPERLVFPSDYPQDFTGVNTDTGKDMSDLRRYVDTLRGLPLAEKTKNAMLGGTAAALLKI